MKPLRVLSLFDGIGCGRLVLHNLGIPVSKYVAAEIEPNAIKVAKSNFSDIEHVGDVTKVNIKEGEFDLILCGSPCQGFSRSGKGLNFNDPRSALYFEFLRILNEGKPKWWLLENNKMKKEWEDTITQGVGVNPLFIPADLISYARRDRLYWTSIPNVTIPEDNQLHLKDIVGEYESCWVHPRGFNKGGLTSYFGKMPTVTCSSWQHNFKLYQNGVIRQFTPNEVELAMGFPKDYTKAVTPNMRIKKLGNSWDVNVITHILKNLLTLP